MDAEWTVRRMLAWMAEDFATRGVPSARLDADLLLGRALGCDRVRLYLDFDRPLSADELAATRDLVRRRRRREPVAYILGEKEFYKRSFRVTPAVLVPRPETESLVDSVLEGLAPNTARALDLCTGSGAIALTLAAERAGIRVDATDLSEDALAVARENAAQLELSERVDFFVGDLFAPLPPERRYGCVVANPPYVAASEWAGLEPDVREHEPRLALVADDDGLGVIRRIVDEAPRWLEPGGRLLMEIGHRQAAAVVACVQADSRYASVSVHRDLGGIERIVEASVPEGARGPR